MKVIAKGIVAAVMIVLLCGAAFAAKASEEEFSVNELVGKKVVVDYETGYLFQVEYLSDNTLRWTSLKERTDGNPMTGDETYYAYKIRDGLYNINWIEAGGLAVSQILDLSEKKVYAFMTWNDKDARGGRAHLLHKGILKVVD